MNRQEYLLSCLAEECAEVAQRASKALRFGIDEVQPGQALTNAERINHELADVFAVLDILTEENILPDYPGGTVHIEAKKETLEKLMEYSRQRGALT